jgi:hypothetical protein
MVIEIDENRHLIIRRKIDMQEKPALPILRRLVIVK